MRICFEYDSLESVQRKVSDKKTRNNIGAEFGRSEQVKARCDRIKNNDFSQRMKTSYRLEISIWIVITGVDASSCLPTAFGLAS